MYPHLAAASGATAVTVDLDDDERHDLPAMAAAVTVATRLLIVCNPNNPTATAVRTARSGWSSASRHVCVIVGEAYCEFNGSTIPTPRSTCSSATPTWSSCARSPRSTACAGCASATRCAGRRPSARRSTRCASRSSATPPRRRPRWRPQAPGRGGPARGATIAARLEVEAGLRGLGVEPTESQANFVWFALPGETRDEERRGGGGDRRRAGRAQDPRARRDGPGPRARCASPSAPRWRTMRLIEALGELL